MKTPSFTLRLAVLAGLSFTLGMLVGCGDITATMVDPPAADAGAGDIGASSLDTTPRGTVEPFPFDAHPPAPADADNEAPRVEAVDSAGEGSAQDTIRAPHCQGAAADYRVTVCKPACGTCGKLGEASTYIAGCWTTDDFHCVDSCGDCR